MSRFDEGIHCALAGGAIWQHRRSLQVRCCSSNVVEDLQMMSLSEHGIDHFQPFDLLIGGDVRLGSRLQSRESRQSTRTFDDIRHRRSSINRLL